MYKVYKSSQVIVGNKKEIKINRENILKTNKENLEEQKIDNKESSILLETDEKVKQILEKAKLEYRQLLEEAKKEADILLEEAYENSKKIYENAKTQGYYEGFAIGKEKGYNEYLQLLEETVEIKKEILQKKKNLAKELEEDIVDLLIYCVNKILDYELDKNHELLLNLVKKGLEKATFTETLVIRVAEDDYEILNTYKHRIYMLTEGIDEVQIKSDAALSKGSVIIETLSGRIDASIETQVNQIKALFKELLKSEGFYEEDSVAEI